MILTRSGFRALAVYSGKAAVDVLGSFEPDVLISDVMMPEMTGIEAAIAIVARRPLCRIVLFSGQAGTVDLLQDARARGHFFEILEKPMHPSTLLSKLQAPCSRCRCNAMAQSGQDAPLAHPDDAG